MTKLTNEDQRRSAIGYIQQQLGSGRTLARFLVKNVNLSRGALAVLNPVPLKAEQISEFQWGHCPPTGESAEHLQIEGRTVVGYPKANSYGELASLIHSFLKNPECLCILENMLASPGDPWLERAQSCVLTHGQEVYHVLDGKNRSDETIETALREVESPIVFVGAIGRQPVNPIAVKPGAAISAKQLVAFAELASAIFIEAYDGEGFVIWTAEVASQESVRNYGR